MKNNKIKKYFSMKLATNPGQLVLFGIIVFNVILYLVSTVAIMYARLPGAENMSFAEASFYAIRVIMTGNMDYDIGEIGSGAFAACVVNVLSTVLGTIFFTGSLIAYMTNAIAKFMNYNNPVGRSLKIYDHIVFLGWNQRATEILRGLLYTGKRHDVVIITPEDREKIKTMIDESITDAIFIHNKEVKAQSATEPFMKRRSYYRKNKIRNRLVFIIRHGETYSAQQLKDVALSTAKAIIILGHDGRQTLTEEEKLRNSKFGDAQVLKTVMQVVDVASSDDSANNQSVIVEVEDDMTLGLIGKIINDKSAPDKCSVIPIPVTRTIGNLIAMFALMPSLGKIYNEIFTIGGMDIGIERIGRTSTIEYVRNYLNTHVCDLPLNVLNAGDKVYGSFAGKAYEKSAVYPEANETATPIKTACDRSGNVNDIIIIGHSSKLKTIISMIDNALAGSGESVRLLLADDRKRVSELSTRYCTVDEVYAEHSDAIELFVAINRFITSAKREVTIVLLSDDAVSEAKTDDETIANLLHLKEWLYLLEAKGLNVDKIRIIVEIINPTHYDIIKNYGVNNIIISNRLISKMMTQFAFESSLFELYGKMIEKYGATNRNSGMEIFTQRAADFFTEGLPEGVSAFDLVRGIFEGSISDNGYLVLLGIIDEADNMLLFDTDRRSVYPVLTPDTLLICYRGNIA